MALTESEYKSILLDDQGNSVFVDYALFLKEAGRTAEAMDVCLAGLSVNPTLAKGRLLLARLFYEKKYIPFAVRELESINSQLPEIEAVKKLLLKLSPKSEAVEASGVKKNKTAESQSTVAEVEFDIGELDMIGDDRKTSKN